MSPGIRYMLASTLVFSVMSVLVKIAGQRIPTQEIVLARSLVSLALSWLMVRRARIPLWGTHPKLLILRGLFGFGALSCFFYSLAHIPLGEAMVIQYTSPLITALLAGVILGEAITRRLVLSTALSLIGMLAVARPAALLSGSSSGLDPLAFGVAVAGAFFSASAYVVVRKLGKDEDSLVIVFYFPLVAVPATLPSVITSFVMPHGIEWLVLLGVGVTTQFAQVYLTRALQLEAAGRVTSVTYLQIVLGMLWGVAFFHEVPVPWTIAGAGLVIAGTAISALQRPGPRTPEAPPR